MNVDFKKELWTSLVLQYGDSTPQIYELVLESKIGKPISVWDVPTRGMYMTERFVPSEEVKNEPPQSFLRSLGSTFPQLQT